MLDCAHIKTVAVVTTLGGTIELGKLWYKAELLTNDEYIRVLERFPTNHMFRVECRREN